MYTHMQTVSEPTRSCEFEHSDIHRFETAIDVKCQHLVRVHQPQRVRHGPVLAVAGCRHRLQFELQAAPRVLLLQKAVAEPPSPPTPSSTARVSANDMREISVPSVHSPPNRHRRAPASVLPSVLPLVAHARHKSWEYLSNLPLKAEIG